MFRLNEVDFANLKTPSSASNLKSQIVTSSWGRSRKAPLAFTAIEALSVAVLGMRRRCERDASGHPNATDGLRLRELGEVEGLGKLLLTGQIRQGHPALAPNSSADRQPNGIFQRNAGAGLEQCLARDGFTPRSRTSRRAFRSAHLLDANCSPLRKTSLTTTLSDNDNAMLTESSPGFSQNLTTWMVGADVVLKRDATALVSSPRPHGALLVRSGIFASRSTCQPALRGSLANTGDGGTFRWRARHLLELDINPAVTLALERQIRNDLVEQRSGLSQRAFRFNPDGNWPVANVCCVVGGLEPQKGLGRREIPAGRQAHQEHPHEAHQPHRHANLLNSRV